MAAGYNEKVYVQQQPRGFRELRCQYLEVCGSNLTSCEFRYPLVPRPHICAEIECKFALHHHPD